MPASKASTAVGGEAPRAHDGGDGAYGDALAVGGHAVGEATVAARAAAMSSRASCSPASSAAMSVAGQVEGREEARHPRDDGRVVGLARGGRAGRP
jgi:hypothetical protein